MKKIFKKRILTGFLVASIGVISLVSCTHNISNDVTEIRQKAVVSINEFSNGTVNLLVDGANILPTSEGTYQIDLNKTATFVVTPNNGYKLFSLTINGVDISESLEFTFSLATTYQVEVTFALIEEEDGNNEEEKKATIQISDDIQNGQISFRNFNNPAEVALNSTIYVVSTPNNGYYLSSLTVNGSDILSSKYFVASEAITYTVSATFASSQDDEVNYDYLYANSRIYPSRGSQSVDIDEYYEPIRGLSGEALKNGLHQIIHEHTEYSYSDLWESMPETDVDIDNPNKIIRTYEGSVNENGSSTFNREHTWAKSHGGFGESRPCGTDMHHLRPADYDLNSWRGSYDFGVVASHSSSNTQQSKSWWTDAMDGNYVGTGLNTTATVFEPKDEFKGDVARMIFYMAVRYDGSNGELNLEVSGKRDTSRYNTFNYGSADGRHGNFVDLYDWATSTIDPVSDFEVNRNNIIDQEYQHNRNPFIDHPEFIEMIYDKNYSGPGALNDK